MNNSCLVFTSLAGFYSIDVTSGTVLNLFVPIPQPKNGIQPLVLCMYKLVALKLNCLRRQSITFQTCASLLIFQFLSNKMFKQEEGLERTFLVFDGEQLVAKV